MKRITIAALLFAVTLPLCAKPKASALKPVLIYSMEHCAACEALAGALLDSGTRLKVTHTDSLSVSSFPTVVYSDGKRDSGSRIQNGICELPSSLRVIKWDGE
jgi:hypothetical protein